MIRRLLPLFAAASLCAGCASQRMLIANNPAIRYHLAQGSITDVTLVKKEVGKRRILFVPAVLREEFLEGYIIGKVMEWDGTPAVGVQVKGEWLEKAKPVLKVKSSDEEDLLEETSMEESESTVIPEVQDAIIDEVVTGESGEYRLRFSVPVIKGKVELKGRLLFNPDWKARLNKYGRSYEPWLPDTNVELYFYKRTGSLAFLEGPRRNIVQFHGTRSLPARKLQASAKPRAAYAKKSQAKQSGSGPLSDLKKFLAANNLDKVTSAKESTRFVNMDFKENAVFVPGGTQISEEGKNVLATFSKWLKSQPGIINLQTAQLSDDKLGPERLAAVAVFLQNQGVAVDRITTYPSAHPDFRGLRISLVI